MVDVRPEVEAASLVTPRMDLVVRARRQPQDQPPRHHRREAMSDMVMRFVCHYVENPFGAILGRSIVHHQ